MDLLNTLVDKGLRRELPTREEALAVLATRHDLLGGVRRGQVADQCFGGRKRHWSSSGVRPGHAGMSQLGSKAGILMYTWLKPDEASKAAAAGVAGGAKRVCLVASGRGPTDRDVDRVTKTIEAIKEQNEGVEVALSGGSPMDRRPCAPRVAEGQPQPRAAEVPCWRHGHTFLGDRVEPCGRPRLGGLWRVRARDWARATRTGRGFGCGTARRSGAGVGLPGVADVRVLGAIGVVQLDHEVDMAAATRAAVREGVWLRPFRDLVYTMPPYVTGDDDVQRICRAVCAAAREG
ncbi:Adenosylmethionine-8-amino-7-oxononanoate aminotransferase [Streptomyces microflavus]